MLNLKLGRSFLLVAIVSIGSQAIGLGALHATDNKNLVDFSSPESMARFSSAKAKVDFFSLANHFEAQSNAIFCGPTTAAIILNAFRAGKTDLPKDRSRLNQADLKFLPEGFDPVLARYTQETVLEKSPKPLLEVWGKPVTIQGKEAKDFGFQLRQFEALLKAHGLVTQLHIADAKLSDATILKDMVENLGRSGDYVIVNYKRTEVGQQGGGHLSPIGAYDERSNSFLILDVNPAKASWVWMPAETLIKGMRSFDTVENRGYLSVKDGQSK